MTTDDPLNGPHFLTRADAARYVTERWFPCSSKTLAKIACVSSDGPPFRRVNRRPLYASADLDAWARSKIGPLQRSTSDSGVPRRSTSDKAA